MRTLHVRADEIRAGDEIAVDGVVGTVTAVEHAGSSVPNVKVAIRSGWGTTTSEILPAARPVVVDR